MSDSSTADTFDEPGGNYPDKGEGHPNADGSGPDEGGEWSGPVSSGDNEPSPQTEPAQDMNDTTADERLEGVIVQTRGDIVVQGIDDRATASRLLAQRLADIGVVVEGDELDDLVARTMSWDDDARIDPGVH
ncbi:hypothetical protein LG299_07985 [Microbacterium lacus]|uniref:hypothetical protein n=1 Tax=Microbacterium lacus TaxID=415217 RepID=UPI00384C4735